jgi:HK97 gp10 family phage protein
MSRSVARIEGMAPLIKALQDTPKKARKMLAAMLKESAEATAKDARRLVPVDRGDLKAAINVYGKGTLWRAGVEDENIESRRRKGGTGTAQPSHLNPFVYAHFVEYGTSRHSARPFMKPASEAETQRLPGRLRVLAALIETQAEE